MMGMLNWRCILARRIWIAAALYAGLGRLSNAAENGSIAGAVKDISGAVIPKARVRAINIDTGIETVVATNSSGVYVFSSLAVGHYDVDIAVKGFKPLSSKIDSCSKIRC
jgi:hypothetical protein